MSIRCMAGDASGVRCGGQSTCIGATCVVGSFSCLVVALHVWTCIPFKLYHYETYHHASSRFLVFSVHV